MSDEKTEEPTQKKLDDARKKGQNPKSQDLSTGLMLLVMTGTLSAASLMTLQRLASGVERAVDAIGRTGAGTDLMPLLWTSALDLLIAVLPLVGVSMFVGVVGQAAQVGLNVSFEPVELKFDKINPAAGLKKIFSMKSVVEFVKTLLKAAAMLAVLWVVIRDLLPLLMGAVYLQPALIAELGWHGLMRLMGGAVLVFLVLGPLDFGLQKFMFLRDQRMSKDEVKREYKESEGDPQLKGKRKQIAREMATSAPQQTVPGASVVVTNPTHFAVALRYRPGETAVPVVVAKGADGEAMLIRRIAEEHGVPVVGEPPLARALFKLPLGEPIPEPMFEAVAAVLRWVADVRAAPR